MTVEDNSLTPEVLDTIDRYYNGSMVQDERAIFEKKLHRNADFRAIVEDLKTTILGIETQLLKERLDEFHNEIYRESPQPSKKGTPSLKFINIAIAAGIIIALGVFWLKDGTANDRLFSSYFKPDPGLATTMGFSDNFAFYDAMVNYKQGDYKTALSKWEKLVDKAPQNDTLNYFMGVAYLADEKVENAVRHLNTTIQNPQSVFLEDAYFYLGLAYLKSGQTEDAIHAFQQSNSGKSRDILRELQ